ncbi:toxin-antitoxin system YwqK family antitoxin [Winogradskyella tangerina]|uniref:toxin-antitoxin system YwqK family antitoxin n=1 Tax=Winogradskyella tangerina TaxID=2023240 RepID=UPI000DBE2D6D|nr:hypothetical protein [Winogradskyella tangerina]
MKLRFLYIWFGLFLSTVQGQKLSLNDLENICQKKNWENVNQFLMNKGWEYYESSKGDSESYNTITWSYDKSYDDKASAWFYLYTYEGFPNKVSYSVFNKSSYTAVQKSLNAKGYKLMNSEIKDDELISNYTNQKFLLTITTEKREKESYSSFDKSVTAYGFTLIKKSSAYDPSNGLKKLYFDNSQQVEIIYNVKDGKLEGNYKRFYKNGNLRIEGAYKNDLKHGLWKDYDEVGNLVNTYNLNKGELNGKSIEYKPEGKIRKIEFFKNGVLDGETTDFFYDEETDRIKAKVFTNYSDGKLDGETKLIFIDENNNQLVLSKVLFKNDQKNGFAQEISEDTLIIANYKNDKLNGNFRRYRDLKKLLVGGVIQSDTTKLYLTDIGQYQNGLKTGYWKHFELAGGLSEGNYSRDLKTGPWKFHYSRMSSNDKEETYSQELYLVENYSNGMRNGLSERFSQISYQTYKCDKLDENNQTQDSCKRRIYNKIHLLANYKNDELHGLYTLKDSLGNLRFKGNYNYGKEQGEWIESYTIETEEDPIYVYKKGNYQSGAKDGKWIEYLNDDHILVESNYKYNLLNGLLTRYNLDGIKQEEKLFKSNKLKEFRVYDGQGQNIEKVYKILSETRDAFKVRFIQYLNEEGRLEADYHIAKSTADVPHYDFRELFHNEMKGSSKSYQDGIVLLANADGNIVFKGNIYKSAMTGTWEHNYPNQNVKIVTKYVDFSNKPKEETYYTLDTNQLFDGEFIYTDDDTGNYEERRVRDGLRNGTTTYYNKAGDKLKKEKYKDGILKD